MYWNQRVEPAYTIQSTVQSTEAVQSADPGLEYLRETIKSPVGLHKQIDYKAFNKKVQNALKKCSYFMEEAFTCESSLEKINKERSFIWNFHTRDLGNRS